MLFVVEQRAGHPGRSGPQKSNAYTWPYCLAPSYLSTNPIGIRGNEWPERGALPVPECWSAAAKSPDRPAMWRVATHGLLVGAAAAHGKRFSLANTSHAKLGLGAPRGDTSGRGARDREDSDGVTRPDDSVESDQ